MTFIPSSGGGGGNVFIYREAEPSPTGNVFSTFAAAYAARIAFVGPADILVDDTLSPGNATMHAGAFDFDNTVLRGMQIAFGNSLPYMTTILQIPDETITIANLRDVRDLVIVNGSSVGPVMTTCNGNQDQLTLRNASIINNFVPPFIQLNGSNTNQFNLALLEGSQVQGNGGAAIGAVNFMNYVFVVDGVSNNDNGANPSKFFPSSLSNDGTNGGLTVYVSGGGVFDGSQPGFTGVPFKQFFAEDQAQVLFFDFSGTITEVRSDLTYIFEGFTAPRSVTIPTSSAGRIKLVDGDGSLAAHTLTIIGTVDGIVNPVLSATSPGSRGSRTIEYTQLGWVTVDQHSTVTAGATPNVFIYKVGGSAFGNVFISFAAAYAARAAFAGPAVIFIDDSASPSGAVTGAGTFNLNDTMLEGCLNFGEAYGTARLQCDAGCVFQGLRHVKNLQLFATNNSTAIMTVDPFNEAPESLLVLDNAAIQTNSVSGAPFIKIVPLSGGVDYSIHLLNGSSLNGFFATFGAVQVTGGARLVVRMGGVGPTDSNQVSAITQNALYADTPGELALILIDGVGMFDNRQSKWTTGTPIASSVLGRTQLTTTDADIAVTANGLLTSSAEITCGFKGLTATRTGTLDANMPIGARVTFVDLDGSLAAHDFDIAGNGTNVQGVATFAMTAAMGARASLTFELFAVTGWVIVG